MQHERTRIERWEWAALAVILLLAGALRLGVPGIIEFKRDEGNLARAALDMAHGRELPLLGLSASVNLPNPPLSVYVLAPPFMLDSSPVTATLYIGALNVLAVALTWWLARSYYGATAALAAALLYATSPWGAIYSRKLWAQDILPPFVLLTGLSGLLGYAENKRWARLAHWALLAITVQIHIGAFTLIPLSLLMLLRWRARVHWRELGVALALAALTGVPVLAGYARDDLLDLDVIRERIASSESDPGYRISTTALDHAWLTVAGTDIHSLAGPDAFRAYLDRVPDEVAYPLFAWIPLGAMISAAWLAWRGLRRHAAARAPDVILAVWLVIPVLAFTYEWTEVAPHYFIPLMPAAFMLCGAGIAALVEALHAPRARSTALGLIALLPVVTGALQVGLFAALLRFVDTHATPGGFGTPLHYLLDARDAVLARDPDDVIVISDEERAPFDTIPAVWDVLLDAVPQVRFVDGTRTAVLPQGAAWELIAWSPDLRTCDKECRDSNTTIAQRPGEPPYVLRPAPGSVPSVAFTAIEPQHFANGAHLTGYARTEESVILRWTLDGPVDADYQAFVHALDADGARIAQADRPAWPGHYWRAGDTLVLWFDLALRPETAALFTGMYVTDGVTYQNAALVDANGAYLDQGATIPLAGE